MKILLTSIFVYDPVKAYAFYTDVLGFAGKMFVPEAELAIVVSTEAVGLAKYSSDGGATWMEGTNTSGPLREVINDGTGRWVAVGDLAIRVSDDGQTWTAGSPNPPGMLFGLATDGAGRWVTVGEDGFTAYSDDGGATWETGNTGTSTTLLAVAAGPDVE